MVTNTAPSTMYSSALHRGHRRSVTSCPTRQPSSYDLRVWTSTGGGELIASIRNLNGTGADRHPEFEGVPDRKKAALASAAVEVYNQWKEAQ